MTKDEIRVEYDFLKTKYEKEGKEKAQSNLNNLYNLARACMDEGAHDIGLEVVDYCKSILESMITGATGMSMRDTNDFLIAHPEYADWRYTMYWDFVLEETFDRFEPFMFYMERKRPFSKKFYEPRRYTKQGKVALKQVADELENLENRKYKFLGVSLPSRIGKLIADYTPVLTKEGWKNHGDLVVGDEVVGLNGEWVKVTYVHPKNVANKRVFFMDGSFIDCHENHEWVVYDKGATKETVVETKQIQKNLTMENDNRFRYYLPIKEPFKGETRNDLPIPPYVLGAWLGDGNNTKPDITICDTDLEILHEIEKHYRNTRIYNQVGCKRYAFENLRADLKQMGMCYSQMTTEKHIPTRYILADEKQRLDLLAGLIDTDGTLKTGENRYVITTSSKLLKNDIIELVSTFGWRISVSVQEPKLSTSGIQGKHRIYVIGFSPTFEIPCRVPRKQLTTFSKQRRIGICDVEDIEPVSGNCITVQGGIYRVGKQLIPTHNSTICIFYLCWKGIRNPNSHSAMGGHAGTLVKGFYKELLNFMTSEEYSFKEIFDRWHIGHTMVRDKSAEDLTITLDEPDRFATITCRGIDATWTGAIDVSRDGILYVDDLVRDRQHSLSPTRMEETFQEYLNKMVDRKNDGAQELMVGTLWNVLDPLERLSKMYAHNPEYKFLRIPALDENDESNFDYILNGFSTTYYKEMRERLDNAEWQAKFQQRPFVREGLLFPPEEFKYFDGYVLTSDVKRVYAVIDPAFGGDDALSMPICYELKNGRRLIVEWIYDGRTIKYTIPRIVRAMSQHNITEVRVEKNGAGLLLEKDIREEMNKQGVHGCKLVSVSAPNRMSKEDKIMGYSDFVKDNFEFLPYERNNVTEQEVNDPDIMHFKRDADYNKAMDCTCMYVTDGKNPSDDAPDSLAQLAIMVQKKTNGQIEVLHIEGGL